MSDKFLNDNWLREQLREKELDDDNFTKLTMFQINQDEIVVKNEHLVDAGHKNKHKSFAYALAFAIIVAISISASLLHFYNFDAELLSSPNLLDSPTLLSVNPLFPFSVLFVFALIWLTEDIEIL